MREKPTGKSLTFELLYALSLGVPHSKVVPGYCEPAVYFRDILLG